MGLATKAILAFLRAAQAADGVKDVVLARIQPKSVVVPTAQVTKPVPKPTSKELSQSQVEYGVSDFSRSVYARGADPATYAAYIQAAEYGDWTMLVDFLSDVLRRDGHARGLVDSRRNAVSGRPWTILRPDDDEDGFITAAVQDMVAKLSFGSSDPGRPQLTFQDALHDLTAAFYFGVGLHEILWTVDNGVQRPSALLWRPLQRFFVNTWRQDETLGELLLSGFIGDRMGERLQRDKWVIHRPRSLPDFQYRQGVGSILGWLWVMKSLAMRDWNVLSELTGVPMRIAKYPTEGVGGNNVSLIDELKDAMANVGVEFYAVVPKETEIEFIQAQSQGKDTFHRVLSEWVNTEMSKAAHGHGAAADAVSGQLGGTDLASSIRRDIIEGDARALEQTITRDLFTPFVRRNFGPDASVPRLSIDVSEPIDLDKRSQVDVRFLTAGLPIRDSQLRELYGYERPEDGDLVLTASGPKVYAEPEPEGEINE